MAEQDYEQHYDSDKDRRIQSAIVQAVQAEQLKNLSADVNEVKKLVSEHIGIEEAEFKKIHDCLSTLHQSIDNKITEAITPIKSDVTRYKTILNYTIYLGGGFFAILVAFRDAIFRFFGH